MSKTLKNAQEGDVLPPPVDDGSEDRAKARVNLVTLGEIRREMAVVYNANRRNEISAEVLTRRIWALRQLANTARDIELLGLDSKDDADTREQFTGMQIVAPEKPRLVADNSTPPKKGNGHADPT